MDKIGFTVNTVWCVLIVSLIVILNLLKIDVSLQLPIIIILMIPLAYINYFISKSILTFLNVTENDLTPENKELFETMTFLAALALERL
jgi:hypothetical protein